MNCNPFKCSVFYLCHCGTLQAPLTLKQEVVGSNTTFYTFLLQILWKFHRIVIENSTVASVLDLSETGKITDRENFNESLRLG